MPFLKVIKDSYVKRKTEISKRNGLRHAIFTPKSKKLFKGYYRGEWKNDMKEGRGKMLDRDGWIYEGNWLNNKKNGYGVLSKFSKEDHTIHQHYIGEWVDGKKQGFALSWFENGSMYEGDFCRNERHGYGRMWHCNGDYYEGSWRNDFYHGLGMLVKANGNRYEGEFVKGKREGYGTYYHIISGQQQYGFWRNDYFINGTMSDGDFRQSALYPTPYPIPRLELAYIEKSQGTDEIIDHDQITKSISPECSCKKGRKHIIANICVSVNTCPCLESIW
ncbi:MORN repeat-containing protein 3 [Habropoda laboriosa]|uniref:MORN repeat-containing protein 3 n=1 Tax=Habropoda laboriosa TaxID=597456 RepID=A0A0L7R8L8_9HYME|nr:MORN repeat-containing protein 3 [Habropoda laboriosa]